MERFHTCDINDYTCDSMTLWLHGPGFPAFETVLVSAPWRKVSMMKEVSWDDWEELATNIKRHGNSMAATG